MTADGSWYPNIVCLTTTLSTVFLLCNVALLGITCFGPSTNIFPLVLLCYGSNAFAAACAIVGVCVRRALVYGPLICTLFLSIVYYIVSIVMALLGVVNGKCAQAQYYMNAVITLLNAEIGKYSEEHGRVLCAYVVVDAFFSALLFALFFALVLKTLLYTRDQRAGAHSFEEVVSHTYQPTRPMIPPVQRPFTYHT